MDNLEISRSTYNCLSFSLSTNETILVQQGQQLIYYQIWA